MNAHLEEDELSEVEEVQDTLDKEEFLEDLQAIVETPCTNIRTVDACLKSYLALICQKAPELFPYENETWETCAYTLLGSQLFKKRSAHVRKRMLERLRKETANPRIHIVARVLLYDGDQNKETFEMILKEEGLFLRLLRLVREKWNEDRLLWSTALDLLYKVTRMQPLSPDDLDAVDDDIVQHLFGIVEEQSDPVYDNAVIRMLLVLNEQYMVSATSPFTATPLRPTRTPNRVVTTLSTHGADFKTFGASLILMINREDDGCLQLLILKLLYALFTTPDTYEYFYANDLRVLVDVIIRNVRNLPTEELPLQNTYLRVLYPLLNHTQLKYPPHYKKHELLCLLDELAGTGRSEHFEPPDETTVRLVRRCWTVGWLRPASAEDGERAVAQKMLGITLSGMGESSVSVADVARQEVLERGPGAGGTAIAGEA